VAPGFTYRLLPPEADGVNVNVCTPADFLTRFTAR
jgi:hypothetical protein